MGARQLIEAASQCCAQVRGGSVCTRSAVAWRNGLPYCYAHDPDRSHLSVPHAGDRRRRVRWTAEAVEDSILRRVGTTSASGSVRSAAGTYLRHGKGDLGVGNGEFRWRFNPQTGELFWWSAEVPDIVRDSTLHYLQRKGEPVKRETRLPLLSSEEFSAARHRSEPSAPERWP